MFNIVWFGGKSGFVRNNTYYDYFIHVLTANFNSRGPKNNYETWILDLPQNIQRKCPLRHSKKNNAPNFYRCGLAVMNYWKKHSTIV